LSARPGKGFLSSKTVVTGGRLHRDALDRDGAAHCRDVARRAKSRFSKVLAGRKQLVTGVVATRYTEWRLSGDVLQAAW